MITKKEAKKASKYVDKYLTNSELPYSTLFSEALHTTQLYINQAPTSEEYDRANLLQSKLDKISEEFVKCKTGETVTYTTLIGNIQSILGNEE